MDPHYVTISSSFANSSPWQLVDRNRNPVNIGLSITSSSSSAGTGGFQVDITIDDPQGIFPNLTLNSSVTFAKGQSFPANVSIFQSSQAAGGGIPAGSLSAIGFISQPITAFRLTTTSSVPGGNVTLSWLQAGPR